MSTSNKTSKAPYSATPSSSELRIDIFPQADNPRHAFLQVRLNGQFLVSAGIIARNPQALLVSIKDALEGVVPGEVARDIDLRGLNDPILTCLSERSAREGVISIDELEDMPFACGAFVVELWDTLKRIEVIQHLATLRIGDILERLEDKPGEAQRRITFISEQRYARSNWGSEEKRLAELVTRAVELQREMHQNFQREASRHSAQTWPYYVGVAIASLGLAEVLRHHHAEKHRTVFGDVASYSMGHFCLQANRHESDTWNLGRASDWR
jgi:hypothetical protein